LSLGDVWTVAGGGDYMGRPRPVVIIQDDGFDTLSSITVCPVTSNPAEAAFFRPVLQPTAGNGLDRPSHVMADKIATIRRGRVGAHLGQLDETDMEQVERAILVFLGLA